MCIMGILVKMIERTCKKCGETKPLEGFVKEKNCHFGHGFICKKCKAKNLQRHRLENPEKYKEYRRRYYHNNSEKHKERRRQSYNNDPEKHRERRRQYRTNNLEKCRKSLREYRLRSPEKNKENHKKYRLENPERYREYSRRYYANNKEQYGRYRKKTYDMLCDSYIKSLFRHQYGIKAKDITPQMIELKRELITFNRLKKEVLDGFNSRGNKRTEANGQAG